MGCFFSKVPSNELDEITLNRKSLKNDTTTGIFKRKSHISKEDLVMASQFFENLSRQGSQILNPHNESMEKIPIDIYDSTRVIQVKDRRTSGKISPDVGDKEFELLLVENNNKSLRRYSIEIGMQVM